VNARSAGSFSSLLTLSLDAIRTVGPNRPEPTYSKSGYGDVSNGGKRLFPAIPGKCR